MDGGTEVWIEGERLGRTVGADSSDWVAADPITTLADRGTVGPKLQGGAAAVTAGNKPTNEVITPPQ